MRFLYKDLKQEKKHFIIAFFITVLHSLFIIVCPLVTMFLLDEVIVSRDIHMLHFGLALFIVVFVLDPIIGVFKESYLIWLGEKITSNNKKMIFSKVLHSKYQNYEKLKNGDVLSVITNDAKEVGRFSANFFPTILKDILVIIGIIGCMMYISPLIAIFVLIIFFLTYYVNTLFGKYISAKSKTLQIKLDNYYSNIEQVMNAMLTIKSYSQEERVERENYKLVEEIREMYTKLNCIVTIINNLTVLAVVFCQAIIYYCGIKGILENTFTIGRIMALIQYFQMITSPFYELMDMKVKLNVVKPMFARIDNYNQMVNENISLIKNVKIDSIKCRNLGFKYDTEYIFRNINFDLPKKGITLIWGESGAGKSTLCKLFMGLYVPTEGRILFDKTGSDDISLATIRNNIAYVPQNPEVLNENFINNIDYCRKNIPLKDIINVCKKVKLYERILKTEDGLNTVIREKNDLSGGEKSRIAIARALVLKKPIIIMDEPLSALDEENAESICQIINDIGKERLVIIISHYKAKALSPTVILRIENGKIEVEKNVF